jgi:histidinol-phosphate aminotransferase
VAEALEQLGLKVTPSVGNFILIHFPDSAGKRAPDADAFLSQRGIVLRRMDAYSFPNALRMTIGSAEANEAAISALAEFLGKRR